ncbi:MAG: glycoside hydrolase 15 protein [Bathelium mastoideum]|nr:MAG: glycoside hydrolase 15 protein [Bathelium mastoideum]
MKVAPFSAILLSLASACVAQNACQTSTVATSVPPNDTQLALQSYSYCGGSLDVVAYIANLDYNKAVTLFYTNGANESTPLASQALSYISAAPGASGWELWGSNGTDAYLDGVTQLLNLTYAATDIGQTYSQQLGLPVTASGAAAPKGIAQAKPYATPSGLSQDIADWLALSGGNASETIISKNLMFANINIPGAANGTVIAAQSYTSPNYAYNWVRDSSLTMDVVYQLYNAATSASAKAAYADILFQYAGARATEQNDPNLQTGLGEPKFNLNNTVFTGPWGRPQNDGPATSAITLIEFANAYLQNNGSLTTVKELIYESSTNSTQAPVKKDLLFVASNWSSPTYDLWEEEESTHFYDRLVQRRALLMGAAFAQFLNDSATSTTLSNAASALTATLSEFWDEGRQLIVYEYGPVLNNKASYKDVAVVLAILHGYAGDDIYSYTDDQVLVSAYQIATSFIPVFPIANVTTDSTGQILGIPVGRYPEDVYNGTGTTLGNPWYLTTAALAELFYRAANSYNTSGFIAVTNTSLPFWTYFAPNANATAGSSYSSPSTTYNALIGSLEGWADAFVRRIKYHTPAGGHLSEEFNRNTGIAQGAADLTWSYASLLTTAFARAELTGDSSYIRTLANLGI